MAAATAAAGIILPVSGGAAAMGNSSSSSSAAARPASMAERARMAKIPQPEPGLKCPRCESTNTKFCYFNNYSLTQPRHFCKACRRYWTRGGTLRNVPVGGGCRRNKRGGKSSSKKPSSSSSGASPAIGVMAPEQQMQPLPFGGSSRLGFPELSSLHAAAAVDYHLGSFERQQFPFLTRPNTGVDQVQPPPPLMSAGISSYPFGGDGDMPAAGGSAGLITQMASVKMDDIDNNPTLSAAAAPTSSSAREFLGLRGPSLQFWGTGGGAAPGGGGWSDLPAFDLSTSGNIL